MIRKKKVSRRSSKKVIAKRGRKRRKIPPFAKMGKVKWKD